MRTVTLALAIIALSAGLCRADSFGPWWFSPPDDYAHEVTTFGMTYKGPGGAFIFTEDRPANGADLQDLSPAMVTEITGIPVSDQRYLDTITPEDGGQAAITIASDDQAIYMVAVFLRDDRYGAAVFITGTSDVEEEQQALLETEFAPETATVAPVSGPVTWPPPLVDNRATTRPRVSAAAAVGMDIDPDSYPLPGTFACFQVDAPRAMTPEPDVTVSFSPSGSYTIAGGGQSGQGGWRIEPDDTFDTVIRLSGTLADEDYIVLNRDSVGQGFIMDSPFSDEEVELECYQDGPATEQVQQAMATSALSQGLLACTKSDGSTFTLMLGAGAYRMPEGPGNVSTALYSYSGDTWQTRLTFTSGPLSLYLGEAEGDSSGQVRLDLTTEWHTGSLFYSSTETTTFARCLLQREPRPPMLYGLDPAPAAASPKGGLPEGLFRSYEGRVESFGTGFNYVFREILTYVAPGGWIVRDLEPDDLGGMPDCTRSSPDGMAFCGEYRMSAQRVSIREVDDDDWGDRERARRMNDGFVLDDVEFTLVEPLDPAALAGVWVADSFTGGGPGFGGGVGVYTDADVFWQFDADGRFAWRESGTTETLITPDPILGGALGGGSSSFFDAGEGSYAFDGLWLTLRFDDGRLKRQIVLPSDGDEGPMLTIGGHLLKQG
jgi:hypothetical protein